jgi:hypothetical protein
VVGKELTARRAERRGRGPERPEPDQGLKETRRDTSRLRQEAKEATVSGQVAPSQQAPAAVQGMPGKETEPSRPAGPAQRIVVSDGPAVGGLSGWRLVATRRIAERETKNAGLTGPQASGS